MLATTPFAELSDVLLSSIFRRSSGEFNVRHRNGLLTLTVQDIARTRNSGNFRDGGYGASVAARRKTQRTTLFVELWVVPYEGIALELAHNLATGARG
jgi:hypothetical protein